MNLSFFSFWSLFHVQVLKTSLDSPPISQKKEKKTIKRGKLFNSRVASTNLIRLCGPPTELCSIIYSTKFHFRESKSMSSSSSTIMIYPSKTLNLNLFIFSLRFCNISCVYFNYHDYEYFHCHYCFVQIMKSKILSIEILS